MTNCEEYSYEKCPGDCQLCDDAVWSSQLKCYSKEFCEIAFECNRYAVEDCPDGCSVCPPCIECSSIVYQPDELCEEMGFEEDWYDQP